MAVTQPRALTGARQHFSFEGRVLKVSQFRWRWAVLLPLFSLHRLIQISSRGSQGGLTDLLVLKAQVGQPQWEYCYYYPEGMKSTSEPACAPSWWEKGVSSWPQSQPVFHFCLRPLSATGCGCLLIGGCSCPREVPCDTRNGLLRICCPKLYLCLLLVVVWHRTS